MAALAPLEQRNLGGTWAEVITVTDASAWGAGIMTRHALKADVQEVGAYNDRWRSGRGEEPAVRPRGGLDLDLSVGGSAPAVPDRRWGGEWKRVVSRCWRNDEAQVILEGRSIAPDLPQSRAPPSSTPRSHRRARSRLGLDQGSEQQCRSVGGVPQGRRSLSERNAADAAAVTAAMPVKTAQPLLGLSRDRLHGSPRWRL